MDIDIKKIEQYIIDHPGKKAIDIADAQNIPTRTTERYLQKLKSIDKIEFKGPPKTGGYFPVDNKKL
ncbi:MAG: hypothetical protein HQK75_03010 [Candidatus Magnetomorum sp.]|nr:hypothetical protein [Candidatus Magnetomorum sp.]